MMEELHDRKGATCGHRLRGNGRDEMAIGTYVRSNNRKPR